MQLTEAHHGINLVVETGDTIYIGRFDNSNGFQVLMHDCSIHPIDGAEEAEEFVRNTAKYGVAVDQRDVVFDAAAIKRVRLLGDIPKD
jgi:hypothetical protein